MLSMQIRDVTRLWVNVHVVRTLKKEEKKPYTG